MNCNYGYRNDMATNDYSLHCLIYIVLSDSGNGDQRGDRKNFHSRTTRDDYKFSKWLN